MKIYVLKDLFIIFRGIQCLEYNRNYVLGYYRARFTLNYQKFLLSKEMAWHQLGKSSVTIYCFSYTFPPAAGGLAFPTTPLKIMMVST